MVLHVHPQEATAEPQGAADETDALQTPVRHVAPSQLAAMLAAQLPALLTDASNSGESNADCAFEPTTAQESAGHEHAGEKREAASQPVALKAAAQAPACIAPLQQPAGADDEPAPELATALPDAAGAAEAANRRETAVAPASPQQLLLPGEPVSPWFTKAHLTRTPRPCVVLCLAQCLETRSAQLDACVIQNL